MTTGIRHDDLRRRNRAMVISAVRRAGQPSRTEIAATTALSHSTISAISSDLIAEGVLVEVKGGDGAAAKRGRPQVALGLNPEAASVIVAVLSLNSLTAAMVDYAGNTVAEEATRPSTLTLGRDGLMRCVVDAVGRLLAGRPPVSRITLAVQGITDSAARKLLWSPITPHGDVEFAEALETAFAVPVTVVNDCNMIAVALKWQRPERYGDDFVAVLLSNGIGMGLFLKGAIFTGSRSSAGEFGHMVHEPGGALCRCGRNGCIEAYAGNYAVWRNASGMDERELHVADIAEADMRRLAEAARSSDGPARAAFRRAGEAIGYGLGSLFALIDAAPVAFVGPGTAAFDIIEGSMRAAIAATAGGEHSGAIVFDTLPDETPLIRAGAAVTALTRVDQEIFAPGSASVQAFAARRSA